MVIKEASIFVDDRGILKEGNKAAEKLDVVTTEGDRLDKMMQWTKHPVKLQCFGKGRGNLRSMPHSWDPWREDSSSWEWTTYKRKGRCALAAATMPRSGEDFGASGLLLDPLG